MSWPNKEERERFEIEGFIEAYERLPQGRRLEVIARSDKPDWIVRDKQSDQLLGVETTAVYSDDRSVPDNHIAWKGPGDTQQIPSSKAAIRQYEDRLVDAVKAKIAKARAGYDLSNPLVLSIYANEYVSIFLTEDRLNDMVKRNEHTFDQMAPFSEIVIWSLPNGGVFRVRP